MSREKADRLLAGEPGAAVPESPPTGLSAVSAADRLRAYGPNVIATAPPASLIGLAGEQLRDPMSIVLVLAGTLTALTGDRPDTVVIAMVLVLNTVVGIVQHRRAERAVAALRDLTPELATVLRDGSPRTIPTAGVVPGDLVLLGGGDIVPADGRVLTANALTLDESAMTGESMPVPHGAGESLTAGTLIVRGRGTLAVTATGEHSGLGKLAALVRAAPRRRTPLQDRMRRLSATLVVTVLSLTLLVVLLGLLRGEELLTMVVVGASLAVAAVPESLPAVMTVALATGAHRMAGRSAVVRRLSAVETLGSVSVIATDKTGTLTRGSLMAERVWTDPRGTGTDTERTRLLIRDLVICNDAVRMAPHSGDRPDQVRSDGDPLEIALLDLADRYDVSHRGERARWRRLSEVPFDAATRMMTTVHQDGHAGQRRLRVVKGAPESVLPLVPDAQRRAAQVVADRWAADGRRVLAVARSAIAADSAGAMELAGLVAFTDPPRTAAAAVVRRCREAGIRVILVTGDH
ncbi:MAG: cation-translocating P-type ATPase, partial [Nocardioides sp.]